MTTCSTSLQTNRGMRADENEQYVKHNKHTPGDMSRNVYREAYSLEASGRIAECQGSGRRHLYSWQRLRPDMDVFFSVLSISGEMFLFIGGSATFLLLVFTRKLSSRQRIHTCTSKNSVTWDLTILPTSAKRFCAVSGNNPLRYFFLKDGQVYFIPPTIRCSLAPPM